jgi:hypothetical protein
MAGDMGRDSNKTYVTNDYDEQEGDANDCSNGNDA